ncbi:hypothetical protein QBS70_13875 [Cronobacter sakazakii]|nr:hypothetical protein [Cronobacter sakazakii]
MSTISNERVEFYATTKPPFGYTGSDINTMARELLALRKERERAEPVATLYKSGKSAKVIMIGADLADGYTDVFTELQTAPPAPVVPDVAIPYPSNNKEEIAYNAGWNACRDAMLAAAPVDVDDDALPLDPQIAEYEQMMEAEQAQADTTAQQFESLAGKAVVPAGWKLVPIEPTKEMVANMRYHNGGYDKYIKNGYAAMLSVAPEPCK